MRGIVVLAVLLASAIDPAVAAADASSPVPAATSVVCSTGTAESDRVWQVALQRLAEDASGPIGTLPFGATGAGPYTRTSPYSWTSGFYPASLWLAYARTHDPVLLARARAVTGAVLPVARWTGTHDLGFMIGLPASLGIANDPSARRRAGYAKAIATAAASLSARWNANVGAIKSGDYNGRWGLIIDSAMNAPMLLEAAPIVGGSQGARLRARGTQHLLTLAADLVRSDGSTVHRMAFDARTGRSLGPVPGQGLSPSSTWARGQAWAINGFAQAYALSGDSRMLDAARRTADYWLAHVPAGCVPAWDLDVSSDRAPRDSSAAAIAADGLELLGGHDPDPERAARYLGAGRATAATLTGAAWVPSDASSPGILFRQAYNVPADPREGTYAWGDAYLLSALSRQAGAEGRG